MCPSSLCIVLQTHRSPALTTDFTLVCKPHTHTYIHTHTNIHTYTHTSIHIHTYTHIHTQVTHPSDKSHHKGLHRRAMALTKLGRLEEAMAVYKCVYVCMLSSRVDSLWSGVRVCVCVHVCVIVRWGLLSARLHTEELFMWVCKSVNGAREYNQWSKWSIILPSPDGSSNVFGWYEPPLRSFVKETLSAMVYLKGYMKLLLASNKMQAKLCFIMRDRKSVV